MSQFRTPGKQSIRTDAFKTPMTYSPLLSGGKVRPSPSKVDIWKSELGLDDTVIDPVFEDDENKDPNERQDSRNFQVHNMQRELEERNAQRDELLFSIKTLSDRNQQYKQCLEKETATRSQQLRIMSKTHEAHLQEKERTIHNLEAIITSQEGGESCQVESLVEQLLNIQSALAASELSYAQRSIEEAEQVAALKEANQKLLQQNADLKAENEVKQSNWSFDDAKLLNETQYVAAETGEESETSEMNHKSEVENLQSSCNAYCQKIESLETKLKSKEEQMQSTVKHLNEEIHALKKLNRNLSREVRQLNVQLASLGAKSPEVVKKIQQIEDPTEAMSLQRALKTTKEELLSAQYHSAAMEKRAVEAEEQLIGAKTQVANLNEIQERMKIEEEEEMSRVKEEFNQLIQEMDKERDAEICAIKKQHQALFENEIMCLSEEIDRLKSLNEDLCAKMQSFSDLKAQSDSLKRETALLSKNMSCIIVDTKKQICAAIHDVSEHSNLLLKRYRHEMKLRKQYHNELVDLRGNIRVFCRVRPIIAEDGSGQGSTQVIHPDAEDDSQLRVNNKNREQLFSFDRVFHSESSQDQVFSEVQSLVVSCVDGFNVCIFAYGQTGSGKTHTMQGPPDAPGINQRALCQLFETTKIQSDWHYEISVSFLEIYNESIRDLLNSTQTKLEVKRSTEGALHVPGLIQVKVWSHEDVNKMFDYGVENRATASTRMNEHSSRSHALLCIEVCGYNYLTGARTVGRLNLVDLAGSERVSKSGADGERLKEAQSINKSLSSLGDVINALRKNQSHIPYRNSKLTYLLQESLGGDSKTLMIVHVSPVQKNIGETVASLHFGQRVNDIQLGQATKNVS